MHNTTPARPSLESIDAAALLFVSGGCHKRCCCPCPQPVNQQTIVNVPQAAPQIVPQAPAPAPQGPTGDVVSTNVSINGQPVS